MNLRFTLRKLHAFGGILIVLPLVLIVTTGILLQLKKDLSFIQPKERSGEEGEPLLALSQFAEIAKGFDKSIRGFEDIDRVDYRPSKSMAKVLLKTGMELQVDVRTGAILQFHPRRSDLIESLHDGSWFHERAKHWVFLPVALILLGLMFTGTYLFTLPFRSRRRARRRNAAAISSTPRA